MNFAECLAVRFDLIENSYDLEEAIELTKTHLLTDPKDRILHSRTCRLLGLLLFQRYQLHKVPEDFEEAIESMKMAVGYANPAYLPCKEAYFTLYDALITKYEDSANEMDRATAIALIQKAVAFPINIENQKMQAYNAAYWARLAYWRFQGTDLKDNLDRAIFRLSSFSSPLHIERSKRAKSMEFLADLFVCRYNLANDIKDQRKAIQLYC